MKTKKRFLSILLSLVLVLGLMPGMGLTAYATPTETLLTTITGTGSNTSPATSANVSYSVEGVATLTFSGTVIYQASPAWGWWGYGWSATVNAAEGYNITKCIFYDDANRTATDSEAPFVVETTEEDKTPRVNGTTINSSSKGIKKIEVYGYATPAHTHSFTYSASGATITATCTAGCPDSYDTTPATLTIVAAGGTYDGTTAYGATVTNNIPAVTGDTVGDVAYYKVDTQGATTGGTVQTGAPTGAGYYYASVTLTSGSNTYTAVKAFTVAKIDPTAPTGLTATYGQKLSDVVLPTGWTWADSTQSVGNVGDHTFKANFAGDDNYNAASNVDVTVTVSKADATTAMQAASVSIAGTSGKTATVSYALPDGAIYGAVTNSNTEFFTVDTTNGLVLTAAKSWTASDWATDASKTFTVVVSGATNYNNYTLTVTVTPTYKATQTITAADVTATYGDTDAKIEATTTSGGGTLSYMVKSGDAVTVNENTGALTIVKAGSAVITVTAAETDTYAQAIKDVNVTVNTKAMTVSAEDVNVTVDGQPHGITVTVTDPASGATVKYGTEAGSYTLDASPTQTEVGEKTVYYQVTAANYTTCTGSAKVTVSAKSAQTITASNVTATYGDTGVKINASTTGDGGLSYMVKSGDAVTVDASGNLTIVKVGTAVITVTAAETATYAQATKDVNVTVNTKAMTVSAEDVNVTVDGQPHGITVNVTDPATGATVKYGTEQGTYNLDASPTQTEAGEKTVYYQVTADNYTTYIGSAKVTITALPTYEVTYKVVNGTWSDDSTTDKTENVQSGSKPASVPTGMKASQGYTGGSWDEDPADATITGAKTFTYTFTAKQVATVTKAPTSKTLTYTGSAQELVTAGTAEGGEMQYALGENATTAPTTGYTTSIPTATNAGTYYVWYYAKGDENHSDSAPAGPITVTIAQPAEETKTEQSSLTEVSQSLTGIFSSLEELKEAMLQKMTIDGQPAEKDNTAFYNVELLVSHDGGATWVKATEENFPTAGLLVVLPYPEGTNAEDYDFSVSHMFTVTSTRLGTKAGNIETPAATKTAKGLQVTLKGLSPVAIAWRAKASEPTAAPAPTATPKPVPKTGDGDHPVLWFSLILLGLIGLAVLATTLKASRKRK